MSSPHKEIHFESDIVKHLASHGWLEGDPSKYDRELALYPEDVIGWIKDSQPKTWEKLKTANNGSTEKTLLNRLTQVLDKEGSLAVLRQGFKDISSGKIEMC